MKNDMPISSMGFSTRVYNILRLHDIHRLSELLKKREHDLLNMKGFSGKSLLEVIRKLDDHELMLVYQIDPCPFCGNDNDQFDLSFECSKKAILNQRMHFACLVCMKCLTYGPCVRTSLPPTVLDGPDLFNADMKIAQEKYGDAVALWNSRAITL